MRLDSDRKVISLVPNELCKFNFTSAEFYLHRASAAGLQLWHINNNP